MRTPSTFDPVTTGGALRSPGGQFRQITLMPDVYFSAAGTQALQSLSLLPVHRLSDADLAQESGTLSASGDALVATWRSELQRSVLQRFPNLLTISLRATSMARVDLDYTRRRGIHVSNLQSYGDLGTREFVIEQLLKLTRELPLRNGTLPQELSHKRLGLIGLGNVGVLVAESAAALGMDVRYYVPTPRGKRRPAVAQFLPLQELVSTADFVSFHSPAYAEAVAAEHLRLIRPEAGLIVTTLGLPFDLQAFTHWAASAPNPVIFDLCAAHEHLDALKALPTVRVEPLYSARTVESVVRAETMVVSNLARYLHDTADAGTPVPRAQSGAPWNT